MNISTLKKIYRRVIWLEDMFLPLEMRLELYDYISQKAQQFKKEATREYKNLPRGKDLL